MPSVIPTENKVRAVLARFNALTEEDKSNYTRAGRRLGMDHKSIRRYVEQYGPAYGAGPVEATPETLTKVSEAIEWVNQIDEDDLPVDEIVAQHKRQFAMKKAYEEASKLLKVKVKIDGPIGLLHFGDPHVDDDGTDLALMDRHSDLTHVEGVFGCNVGDTTNNWIGRLARLYAAQSMSRPRAIKVAERFIQRTRWLYMLAGNHDMWSGADDPMVWIARQARTVYKSSEIRVGLQFPSGLEVRINARHDFDGASQWNPVHGLMKAASLGTRDHLLVAGHRHISGEGMVKDPTTGIICHCLRVASYKAFDRYAKERGFRDQSCGPAAFTVINTKLPETHPDLIKVYWDPEEGVDYLTFLRKRASAQAKRAA